LGGVEGFALHDTSFLFLFGGIAAKKKEKRMFLGATGPHAPCKL